MGLFDFLKRKPSKQEVVAEDKYWSLATSENEIVDPTVEQIETAVKNATPHQTIFATLTYNHSGLEIESIQAISEDGIYRFEALTTSGTIYVKNDVSYEETIDFFTHFFQYQRVSGFRSWPTESY